MSAAADHLMQAKALLGAVAVEIEQLSVLIDAPPAPSGPKLTADRERAITGLSTEELLAIARISNDEFADYLDRRSDPSPELPLGPPVAHPQSSSITPSRANAKLAQFETTVQELTAAEFSLADMIRSRRYCGGQSESSSCWGCSGNRQKESKFCFFSV